MTTEKTDDAGNPAQETDLAGLREQITKGEEAPQQQTTEAKAPEGQAPAVEEKDEWLAPPSALKPEYKAEWAKLDKKWRAEIYRRENDFHKGIEPYKGAHSKWEAMEKALSPYRPRIQSSGLPDERFIQEFLALDHVFTSGTPQQKQQALETVLQYYGLQAPQPGQQQAPQQLDPTVKALQDKLAKIEGTLTQSQTAAQQREQQEALSAITAFKADPKNIYFEDVKDDMAALLQTGRAKDLADAYDKACWANPTVRTVIAKQRQDEEEQKRIEEAKRKTADARRAGFEVQGQGAAAPGAKALSLNEELRQRFGVA